MTEICESCGKSGLSIKWYCVDDNAEVTLCKPCVTALRKIGEKVEVIK
jgi:hypothetical protein